MQHLFQDPNPEPMTDDINPIAQRIIEAVEKSYDVTLEDAETLLQVIKENQQPVQFKSPFEVNEEVFATRSQSTKLEGSP